MDGAMADLYADLTDDHERHVSAQHEAAVAEADLRVKESETVAAEAKRQLAACQAKVR
jgi:hypothetical protein